MMRLAAFLITPKGRIAGTFYRWSLHRSPPIFISTCCLLHRVKPGGQRSLQVTQLVPLERPGLTRPSLDCSSTSSPFDRVHLAGVAARLVNLPLESATEWNNRMISLLGFLVGEVGVLVQGDS